MSENIQSISMGTYTIGQTSAMNFQAGPGISITQPSEGTVRIANDETVLFDSGSNNGVNSGELSEPYTNFERLLFEVGIYGQNSVGQDGYQWCIGSTRSAYTWVNFMYGQSGSNQYYAAVKIEWTDSTHFTVTNGSSIVHTETSTSVSGNTSNNTSVKSCVIKIVGINRISGGSNE